MIKDPKQFDSLRPYATTRQVAILDAIVEHGTPTKAAKALGVARGTVTNAMTDLRRKAAAVDPAQHDYGKAPLPPGFHIAGVSEMVRNDEGLPKWVKSKVDTDDLLRRQLEQLREVAAEFEGRATPVATPHIPENDNRLACYLWGDPHIGMFSWAEETGDRDWDLKLAESTHVRAVEHLSSLAPPCRRAALITVGDTAHADNPQNRTTRSGHILDVDTRYPKVYRVIGSTMIASIDLALRKHEQVDVHIVPGNHDDVTAYTMAVFLDAWYRNEPRVHVVVAAKRTQYIRFGKCLIGINHGEHAKASEQISIMACDRPQDWGETVYRHVYSGHLHHDILRDYRGGTVETLRTIAPLDAYAAHAGYRSRSDMKLDIWDPEYGFDNRHVVGIERLRR